MIEESFFQLLVPVIGKPASNDNITILCGKPWKLVKFKNFKEAPPFTAISYSWMLEPGQKTSSRTIPVIETVIESFESEDSKEKAIRSFFRDREKYNERIASIHAASSAIWIDSLCVPKDQKMSDLCIHNMGMIYKEATQVFSVMNTSCQNTISKINNNTQLELNDYLDIANDDWIDRTWTYQEFANSKMMFVVSEGQGDVIISELDFLNELMMNDSAYKNLDNKEILQKIERIQLLIAEQNIDNRSTLQVVSSVQNRSSSGNDKLNKINVMLSVISNEVTMNKEQDLPALVEKFISTSEENNDYSFIFSTNSRSNKPGKGWRPIGDQISPIISNIVLLGGTLSGKVTKTHLRVTMCLMQPYKVNLTLRKIETFLKTDFSKDILVQLKQRGFTGCGECLRLKDGYFFPQNSHTHATNFFVAISHSIKFQQGAPALLLCSTDTNSYKFCDTGIFIGSAPDISETINIS